MSVRLTPTEVFHELLVSDARPTERLRLARGPIIEDIQRRLPPLLDPERAPALFLIHQAARLDGYEVGAMQQAWGLFNPTRPVAASAWAVERLSEAIRKEAAANLEAALGAGGVDAEVELLIIPAEPANRNLMVRAHGLSITAGAAGWVLVEVWPSDGNLARLAPALARAAAHQAFAQRQRNQNRALTLAEAIAIETDAAGLAERLGLDLGLPLWRRLFAPPADHTAALQAIAAWAGLDDYDQLDSNIYGHLDRGRDTRVPALGPASDPSEDEHEYNREAIEADRESTDPARIAACLYGDEAVELWGHPGAGYGPFAGLTTAER